MMKEWRDYTPEMVDHPTAEELPIEVEEEVRVAESGDSGVDLKISDTLDNKLEAVLVKVAIRHLK